MVKDIKKSILKKKVMLSFIIDSYAKYDKLFRYSHMFIAASAPIVMLISQQTAGNGDSPSTLSVVLGTIAAGMIKVKEYLKYDKVKDVAKQQTIKYEQLYQRIEREIIKPEIKRQAEDDFIYWINREFNSIEMADPDLNESLKKKFIDACKAKGIPCDDDIDLLGELVKVVVDNVADNIVDRVDKKEDPSNYTDPTSKPPIKLSDIKEPSPKEPSPKEPVQFNQTRRPSIRIRSASDEADRLQYKTMMKTLDPKQDLQWAMDRLGNL